MIKRRFETYLFVIELDFLLEASSAKFCYCDCEVKFHSFISKRRITSILMKVKRYISGSKHGDDKETFP